MLHLCIVSIAPHWHAQCPYIEQQRVELTLFQLWLPSSRHGPAFALHTGAVLLREQRRGNAQIGKERAGDVLAQVRLIRLQAEATRHSGLLRSIPYLVLPACEAQRCLAPQR